jgi:hypothetical protein
MVSDSEEEPISTGAAGKRRRSPELFESSKRLRASSPGNGNYAIATPEAAESLYISSPSPEPVSEDGGREAGRSQLLDRIRQLTSEFRASVCNPGELVPYFVTVTFPGGLTDGHVRRLDTYIRGVHHGGTTFYVIEDGGGTKHRHAHAIFFYHPAKRTDTITRSVRNAIYSDDELRECTGTRRLVRSESVSDLPGIFLYIFKESDFVVEQFRGPSECSHLLQAIGSTVRAYGRLKPRTTDLELFPGDGKTKWISDQKLPDVLLSAADQLGVDLYTHKCFSDLVARCLRKGLRFNFRSLRQARIIMEILHGDAGGWAQTEIHQIANDCYISKI